ncbi:unnamed protein product [Closterium sp. NIES-54]
MRPRSYWAKALVREDAPRASRMKRGRDDHHSEGAGTTASDARRQRRVFRACASTPAATSPAATPEATSPAATPAAASPAATPAAFSGKARMVAEAADTTTGAQQHDEGPEHELHAVGISPMHEPDGSVRQRICDAVTLKCNAGPSWEEYVRSRERLGITVLSAKPLLQPHAGANRGGATRYNYYRAEPVEGCAGELMQPCACKAMERRTCFEKPPCARVLIPDLNLPACEDPGLGNCQISGNSHGGGSSGIRPPPGTSGVQIAESRGAELGELKLSGHKWKQQEQEQQEQPQQEHKRCHLCHSPVAPAVPSPLLSRPVAPPVPSPLLSRPVAHAVLSRRPYRRVAPAVPSRPVAPAVPSPLLSGPVAPTVPSRRPCCPVPSPLLSRPVTHAVPSRRPCCPVPSRRPCCPVPSPLQR